MSDEKTDGKVWSGYAWHEVMELDRRWKAMSFEEQQQARSEWHEGAIVECEPNTPDSEGACPFCGKWFLKGWGHHWNVCRRAYNERKAQEAKEKKIKDGSTALETMCEKCMGERMFGWDDGSAWDCETCNGRGFVPTEEGDKLLAVFQARINALIRSEASNGDARRLLEHNVTKLVQQGGGVTTETGGAK